MADEICFRVWISLLEIVRMRITSIAHRERRRIIKHPRHSLCFFMRCRVRSICTELPHCSPCRLESDTSCRFAGTHADRLFSRCYRERRNFYFNIPIDRFRFNRDRLYQGRPLFLIKYYVCEDTRGTDCRRCDPGRVDGIETSRIRFTPQ